MAFHCVNCEAVCENRKSAARLNRHYPISTRLQDKFHETDPAKPNITIVEAIEEIFESEVTETQLERFAGCYMCKDCLLMLRLAVNKKTEVEQCMSSLHERIDEITSKMRRRYYREHYATDKAGKCWACMYDFSEVNYKPKGVRFKLSAMLIDEMSVEEGIKTLLEEEAESLHGLYSKNTYLCKSCYLLMKQVVKNQCHFETLNSSFMSHSTDNSIIGHLRRGEVPSVVNSQSSQGGEEEVELDDEDNDDEGAELMEYEELDKESSELVSDEDKGVGNRHRNRNYLRNVVKEVGGKKRKSVNTATTESDYRQKKEAKDTVKALRDKKRKGVIRETIERELDVKRCRLVSDNKVIVDKDKCDGENVELAENCDNNFDVADDAQHFILERETVNDGKNDTKDIDADNTESANGCLKLLKDKKTEVVAVDEHECTDLTDDNLEDNCSKMWKKSRNSSENERMQMCKMVLDKKMNEDISTEANTVPLDKDKISTDHSYFERTMSSEDWVIYYYPGISGRAEFIRLLFEEAGVPYRECGETHQRIKQLVNLGGMDGYPHFAPPMLKKGDFQVSQTSVICRFLGDEFGMVPDTKEDRLHAEQINVCCHDYIAEGRLAFHGINPVGPYTSQKEATQPYIDRFVKERLPLWLKFFERVLKANKDGTGFLYGDKISYADLALFHVLQATDAQFPEAYRSADYMPLLKAFEKRTASRPRLAAYLNSNRRIAFYGDSMM